MWKVRKSKVHGTGVFAENDIKNNTKIIQYIGDKVTKKEGDKRSAERIRNILIKKMKVQYIFLN